MKSETVTSIVHHHIKENKLSEFLVWLDKVREESSKFEGHIDSKLIESIGGENEVISIFRFSNQELLKKWIDSNIHKDLIEELNMITDKETQIKSYTGLEFWFDRSNPSNLTMMVITFAGLLPLVLTVPSLISKMLDLNNFMLNALSTAIIVVLMTYIVMPLLMKFREVLIKS